MQQLDPIFDDLGLDPSSELSYLGQIRLQLMLLVADGKLEPGSRLPPVRVLAAQLGVNTNTVRAAYARLEAEGIVATRHGVGTTVLEPRSGHLSPGLPRSMSNTVGVVIAGLDPFYLDLLSGLETQADETRTLLFIVDVRDSEERAVMAIRQLTARGAHGVIAVSIGGPDGPDLAGGGLPFVYVDQPHRSGHSLLFDAEQAGYDATRHLIEHGHERIGYVTCPLDWPNQGALYEGHVRALGEAGRRPDPALVVTVPGFDIDSGRAGARALLDREEPPSAVFASGGILTVGVLKEARQRLAVPGDLAIIGYGDLAVTELTEPALTMVSLPTYEMGVAAMATLQRVLADPTAEPGPTVLRGTLIVRASCGMHPRT